MAKASRIAATANVRSEWRMSIAGFTHLRRVLYGVVTAVAALHTDGNGRSGQSSGRPLATASRVAHL